MPITPITPTGPSAPNTLTPDAAGAVAVPNTLTADAAGTIAIPNTLSADAAGTVGAPNTLTADAAGTIATPNTLAADAAGTIAVPATLASVAPAALPRTLTPLVDLNFADGLYNRSGTPKSFDDILTYSRPSSATFINRKLKNSGGYDYFVDTDFVGNVTNLALYSEQFSNAQWIKFNTEISDDLHKAPDGTFSADKMIETIVTGSKRVGLDGFAVSASTSYSMSIHIKANGRSKGRLRVGTDAGFIGNVIYDLENGTTVLSSGATVVSIFESLPNGWFRIGLTFTTQSNATEFDGGMLLTFDNAGNETYTGDGVSGVFLWGGQLTQTTSALPYVKTINSSLTKAFSESLRVEYDYQTGENLGALIEGASTNLMLQSENFSSWVFVKTNSSTGTVTDNYAKAPDTLTTASRINGTLTDLTGSSRVILRQSLTAAAGDATLSFWVKSLAGATNIKFHRGGNQVGVMAITSEWKRFEYSTTASGSAEATGFEINGDVAASVNFDILVWGGQYEALPVATSYVKTEGSAVSRSRDDLSLSAAGNFTSAEGSTFVNFNFFDNSIANRYAFVIDNNSYDSFLTNVISTAALRTEIRTGGTTVAAYNAPTTLALNTKYKSVIAYELGGVKSFIDGVQYGSDTSAPVFDGMLIIDLGTNRSEVKLNGHISRFTTYNKALTAQEIKLL